MYVQPMVLVFLVMYPPTWTRIYTRIHAHARKFIRLYAFTLWNNSLEFVPFPIYPPPPSTPSLCQFLFHFFHCSLPDASHANGTVFAWSIIIIFFFFPCFLISLHGLFIPFLLANLHDYPDSAPVFVLFFAPYFFT